MRLPKFSPRVQKALRVAGYVNFYVDALALFAYLTFPYDRVRDRVVDEFNAHQTGPDAMRLEIDSLGSYWLSGVEARGVRLISPPKPPAPGSESPAPSVPGVLSIDSAHVRVSFLPLLIGSLRVNFAAKLLGGSVSGETWESDGARRVEVELEDLSLDKATMLADVVGLPLAGSTAGKLELALPEGKLSKADGKLSLKIKGLSAGDGKAKIHDTIALPKVEAGDLDIEGDATAGQLKFTSFGASGPDLELSADGSVRFRDPLPTSLLSMTARFRFNERYTNKNDMTRALFGAPGSNVPALFDMDPKAKRAKSADGFYGWRVSGSLAQPVFAPHPSAAAPGPKPRP